LTLYEGQKLASVGLHQCAGFKFANILGTILQDFIVAGSWPRTVDNSGGKFTEK
jgi:hypothetical protein